MNDGMREPKVKCVSDMIMIFLKKQNNQILWFKCESWSYH